MSEDKLAKKRLEKSSFPLEYLLRFVIIQRFILPFCIKIKISPNQISLLALLCVLFSFLFIDLGYMCAAGVCYLIYSVLDHTDGMLARALGRTSKLGHYLDVFVDNIAFNGVFVMFYFENLVPFWAALLAILSFNIYGFVSTLYLLPRLRRLGGLRRFGIKRFLLEKYQLLLGMDASFIAFVIYVGLFLNFPYTTCLVFAILMLGDLAFRLFEYQVNVRAKGFWQGFYKADLAPNEASQFAKYAKDFFPNHARILELGCGNGRDSKYFLNLGFDLKALDACKDQVDRLGNKAFICADFTKYKSEDDLDVIYSRFSLHSVDLEGEDRIFENLLLTLKPGGLFCAEFRGHLNSLYKKGLDLGGDAFIYDEHFRRFIDFKSFCKKLENTGFELLFAKEERGFAPFKNEDDFFIRIIAKKL